jgi:hypothetical protein
MISELNPPRPVIGLVVSGAILVLLEGLVVLGITAVVSSTVTLPGAIVAVGYGIAGLMIVLAVVLFVLVWAYAREPSGSMGIVFIVLGAVSFLLGAGFLIGGILIVVGGALAVFAEWAEQSFAPEWVTSQVPSGQAPALRGVPSTPAPSPPPPSRERAPGGMWTPTRAGGIVFYRTCPRCGELVPRDAPACSRCGGALPQMGGSGAPGAV